MREVRRGTLRKYPGRSFKRDAAGSRKSKAFDEKILPIQKRWFPVNFNRYKMFIESIDLLSENEQQLDVNDIPNSLLARWIVDADGLEYWEKMLYSEKIDDFVPDDVWIAFHIFFTFYVLHKSVFRRFLAGEPYRMLFLHEESFLYALLLQDTLAFVQSERGQGRSVPPFDVMNLGLYLEYNIRNVPQDFVSEWIDHSKRGM